MNKKWAVIGAGAAGILSVGKLLDNNIRDIVWIDPSFTVGDLGSKWFNVSSNTKVLFFTEFLKACNAFDFDSIPTDINFSDMDPEATCLLKHIVAPLQFITNKFLEQVESVKATVTQVEKQKNEWLITANDKTLTVTNIILATGAEPKLLNYQGDFEVIPLTEALNPELLAKNLTSNDTVAIFGSSHSGILAIKNAIDCGAKVINFYKNPLLYAIFKEDHIVYDNTGLKGLAATWAKQHIEENLHPKLTRYQLDEVDIEKTLAQCSKVIYTIGLSTRKINIINHDITQYDNQTGIIANGLYGIGIACPEFLIDRYGNEEFSVGLFKFAKYINKILSTWLA